MILGESRTRKTNEDPRMIDCAIGSVHYKALVDSGAMVKTVTPLVYEQIKSLGCLFKTLE